MLFLFLGRSIPGTQTIIWGKIEIKTNTVMGVLTASLVTAVLPLCMQFYIYINRPQPDPDLAMNVCESLKGKYTLHFNYIFGEKDGIRLVAREGEWKANNCVPEKEHIALKGPDSTQFDIEFFHKGKYELVASGIFEYPSTLLIGENGKLISRSFKMAGNDTHIQKYYDNWKKIISDEVTMEEVEGAIEKALIVRANIHMQLLTKFCTPTIGDYGGKDALVFICQDYARVMIELTTE
jgi:hypothetical protein